AFQTNNRILITGKVAVYKRQIVFESPEWEIVDSEDDVPENLLIPVYSLTKGVYPRQIRNLVKRVLEQWNSCVPEFIPEEIRRRNALMNIAQAISQIHYPESMEKLLAARRRLAFDELFLIQLGVLNRKRQWQSDQPGHAFKPAGRIIDSFLKGLPFALTGDQNKALAEIMADIQRPKAMSRLLQGDVGSGKTIIAITSLLAAAASGYQSALMAPTEILAEQHYTNICKLLSGYGAHKQGEGHVCCFEGFLKSEISLALLTGRLTEKEKLEVLGKIETGSVDIAIGTHALIQKGVIFKNLGMAVVDEQHRFGVMQRSALRQKGFNPHILVMTATPIPRTLALTLYGDLDISVIRELPPGRQIIKTRWFKHELRKRVYEFISKQVNEGHQAFIICPLIEESDTIEARAAVAEFKRLSEDIFPDFTLGLLHGKMSSVEKDDVMARFRNGDMQILVSTPVVEVGIDVPNATVMLIEGADRFGLAQLHQFRGRVGRGISQSYCLLLSEGSSGDGIERLKWMEKIHDGFELAEKDLDMRGPGEFFGTRQSGLPDLRMAKLSDVQLLTIAREEAVALFSDDSQLQDREKKILTHELARVWPNSAEWS
ncbi:MAG: ATP-dependent DNA helicase RecG, partial [Dehalococcoidia bacterium]|nr:ATP-dependent DNA helicase RecG [Dehalococcoidia bacterium]